MKRYTFTLAMVIASMLVICASLGSASAARKAVGDAPYPTKPAPKPVPPICTPTRAVAVAGGVATLGICKDAKGNKVYGGQFFYKDLAVTGLANSACTVKSTAGSAGTTGRISVVEKGVTVTYTITMWVGKTAKHLASVKTDSRSTRSFTVMMPGKQAGCDGSPTFTGDPNDPAGGNRAGSVAGGFVCAIGGSKRITVTQQAISIPTVFDCSGNGDCNWQIIGRPVTKYWLTYYPGAFECSGNGVSGVPAFYIEYVREDGTECDPTFGGVTTIPLRESWSGSIKSITAWIQSTYRSATKLEYVGLSFEGPFNGTPGGPPLC